MRGDCETCGLNADALQAEIKRLSMLLAKSKTQIREMRGQASCAEGCLKAGTYYMCSKYLRKIQGLQEVKDGG